MNIIRINRQTPTVFETMNHEFDELFNTTLNSFFNSVNPSYNNRFGRVNVAENANNYSVEMLMPGADKNKIDISIQDNLLNVSYKNEDKSETNEKNYIRQEWSYNEFVKKFELPDNVDSSQIDAGYENGILTITLAKKQLVEKPLKQIAVR